MDAGSEVLLEVRAVAKRFGGLVAVRDVTVALRRGEILGLIGPNGSGKTTLLNLISGVYPLTAGEVWLEGRRISGQRASMISQAGVSRTFQKIRLFRGLSALDNVAVALAPERVPRFARQLWLGRVVGRHPRAAERARGLLALVGLEVRATQQARTLSYGEQRLLEIARALATRPKVLLLDEPAAGVSAADVAILRRVLTDLQASRIGIVLVEHHMDVVMQVSTRVVVLDHGEKIFDGLPSTAQRDPAVIMAYLGADGDEH